MSENKFSGVTDTLFIPLIARIEISKKFPAYFRDEKALSLENMFSAGSIAAKSSEYSMMASASRAVVMDKIVSNFIDENENSNIVCIGCGLETMVWRLEKSAHFYGIDFPSVIENRKEILGKHESETLIPGDVNELDLSEYMDCSSPTMFVVAGVFQYFKEEEVLKLLAKLKSGFENAHVLFDAIDEFGINYAQKYVKKTGNKSAMMYFYINDPKEFADKSNTELLGLFGFFEEARKLPKLKFKTRISMKVADDKKHTMILHLKLD